MPVVVIYVAAALLALGAAPLPYGYYMALRVVACAVFVWAAITANSRHQRALTWVFAGAAVLFNPLVKVHLPKEVWAAVDLSAAVLLLATSKRIKG